MARAGAGLARDGRAHGEPTDADDAFLLTERIQRLGGLFGEADDALGADAHFANTLRK